MAALQNPKYLEDPVLRLMFLRANFYKPDDSVKQLTSLLKFKAEYFGKESLGRDITLEDTTEEDKRMLKSGFFHIQAARDKSGRVVTYILNHCFGQFDTATVIRVAFYMWFHIIMPMPGVQTKGMVACYYDCAPPEQESTMFSLGFLAPLISFGQSMPYRYSSMQFCVKNTGNPMRVSLNNSALTLLTRGFPRYSRVRMKIHSGSDIELLYQLQAYGIDLETFPVDVRSGKIRPYEVLNKWYYDYHHKLQAEESAQHSNTAISSINQLDDFDLDKTLDALVDEEEEGMEAKVIEKRTLGGNDEVLDDIPIDWDIDLLKGDRKINLDEGAQDERARSSAQNTGWIQTLARDAFGFGADDVAVNHHEQETPNLGPGGSTISPAFGLSTTATVRTPAARPLSGSPGQTAQTAGSKVPLLDVVEPAPEDILLGRGKSVQNHPGNVNFRQWMEEFREEYERSPRYKKTQIATEMIQILNSNGVRFLKQGQDKKSWVVADSKDAEEKIKQLFRSRRKKRE